MQARIISLLPSATEIVAALGLSQSLVARSHECDFPPEIRRLPACTAREIELTESTPGIQLRAMAPAYRALGVFSIDWDVLRGLHPTHILTETMYAEFGVGKEDLAAVLAEEMIEPPDVISFKSRSLPGVISEIRFAAAALGEEARGEVLAASLEERIAHIATQAKRGARKAPVVACLEWLQPFMLGGNWIPEMIRLAGGIPAGGGDGIPSPWMDWPDLLALDPDVIVSMPCGWRIPRATKETQRAAERTEWQKLKAVRENQVYVVNGSDYFNRPGPRLVDSLEILAEILSPQQFPPIHQPQGWVRFAS
ncbi:MAG: ABC transporter substrate-binding protein [Bryobacterales bacterium]|nr:ABC transporter substrate-binding protein [Bryobacterales bacterium]